MAGSSQDGPTDTSSLNFSIKSSGDGYELVNANCEVIAWTLDRKWALRILLALELLNEECRS